MVNNNSIFNTKYAEFSTKWQVLPHFNNPICACNQHYHLHQKSVPLLQSIFTSIFQLYLFTKSSLQCTHTIPPTIPQQFLTSLFFRTTVPTIFLKVWTVITQLTINESLWLRLIKLVYCRCGKPSNPPSFIHSSYGFYFHTLLILSQELTFSWKPVA